MCHLYSCPKAVSAANNNGASGGSNEAKSAASAKVRVTKQNVKNFLRSILPGSGVEAALDSGDSCNQPDALLRRGTTTSLSTQSTSLSGAVDDDVLDRASRRTSSEAAAGPVINLDVCPSFASQVGRKAMFLHCPTFLAATAQLAEQEQLAQQPSLTSVPEPPEAHEGAAEPSANESVKDHLRHWAGRAGWAIGRSQLWGVIEEAVRKPAPHPLGMGASSLTLNKLMKAASLTRVATQVISDTIAGPEAGMLDRALIKARVRHTVAGASVMWMVVTAGQSVGCDLTHIAQGLDFAHDQLDAIHTVLDLLQNSHQLGDLAKDFMHVGVTVATGMAKRSMDNE